MNPLLRISLPSVLLSVALFGCGRSESTAPAATATPVPANAASAGAVRPDAAMASQATTAARVIEVQGNDMMKFTVTRIEAAPGEQLQIKFVNVGTLPKEAMGHNLVILQKGANPQAYANAALTAKAQDYLPPSLQNQVVAATKMLGPKQTDTITFTVPQEPGEYPYLCSFPAHFVAGMKGVLVVR